MVRLGSNVPPPTGAEDDADRVAALLSSCPVGGVIVFRAAWPGIRGTLDRLQAESEVPLLVASDLERGMGQQVRGATRFPHAMTAGHTPDPERAAAMLARATAREARAAGIHLAFAPVADVHLSAENPIIGPRAFADTPDAVARCVDAYIRSAQAEGLLTCAKHFPGHGRTVTDSHDALPVVDASADVLRETDLVPFQRAIDAGVETVMTAHVAYPSLDETGRPATASAPILQDLLRREMGFAGCVVSDSLLMEGIQTGSGGETDPGAQAAHLVSAGVDLLLDPQEPEAVVDGLVAAVEDGMLARDRLDEAFRRVWALKQRAFSHQAAVAPSRTDPDPFAAAVGGAGHREWAASIARQGATLRPDGPDVHVPADGRGVLVIRFESRADGDASDMREMLDRHLPDAAFRRCLPGDADEHTACRKAAREADLVICAVSSEPAAWQAFGLPDDVEAAAAGILAGPTPSVLAVLGSPQAGDRVETRAGATGGAAQWARVDVYSDEPVSRAALVRGLADRQRDSEGGESARTAEPAPTATGGNAEW
jgi:beta-glucosidase-like glycosyl hydrolase